MCEERERLIGYVYDECDATERRVIEQHLEACPTCRTEIRGLRSVRQDLLAWDVPEHEPVWRPLAEPRVEASWKNWKKTMPAWAMAAAATVLLMIGGAGGAATYALFSFSAAPAVDARVTTPDATSASASASQAALITTLEQRLDRLEQANAPGDARLVSVQPVAASPDVARINATVTRLASQVDSLSERQMQMSGVLVGMTNETVDLRGGLQRLKRDNDNFARQVSFSQNSTGGR